MTGSRQTLFLFSLSQSLSRGGFNQNIFPWSWIKPWSSLLARDESSYLPNCWSNLFIDFMQCLFCFEISQTKQLGRDKPSCPIRYRPHKDRLSSDLDKSLFSIKFSCEGRRYAFSERLTHFQLIESAKRPKVILINSLRSYLASRVL